MKKRKWNKILVVLLAMVTVAMTANAFDEDRKKALESGMDGFLSKPIVIDELLSTLQKNLHECL